MTYAGLMKEAEQKLRDAGFSEARTDVRALMMYVCGMDFVALLRDGDTEVPEDALQRFSVALSERLAHVPVQYITGGIFIALIAITLFFTLKAFA